MSSPVSRRKCATSSAVLSGPLQDGWMESHLLATRSTRARGSFAARQNKFYHSALIEQKVNRLPDDLEWPNDRRELARPKAFPAFVWTYSRNLSPGTRLVHASRPKQSKSTQLVEFRRLTLLTLQKGPPPTVKGKSNLQRFGPAPVDPQIAQPYASIGAAEALEQMKFVLLPASKAGTNALRNSSVQLAPEHIHWHVIPKGQRHTVEPERECPFPSASALALGRATRLTDPPWVGRAYECTVRQGMGPRPRIPCIQRQREGI